MLRLFGSPRLMLVREPDKLAVERSNAFYFRICTNALRVAKQSGGAWVPLRDDRHPSFNNPGYYLDGHYVKPSHNEGCDVWACIRLEDGMTVALAQEYVKTGTLAPPSGEDSDVTPVDVVETQPFHGELRVEVQYSKSETCADTEHAVLSLTVPEDGVCCPIGRAECSSSGPGGGWAPNLESCPAWNIAYDAYFEVEHDPHDCPVLREDTAICCGCPPEDAGP